MKKRRGSTLVLTIMVLAVLMVLSTVLLNVMVTNSKQGVMHRNKIQAYYIARSGAEIVEAAIMDMEEEEIKYLEAYLEENGENKFNLSSENNGGGNFQLDPTKFIKNRDGELESLTISYEKEDGNEKEKLIIRAKAKVANSSERVTKVMEKDPNENGGNNDKDDEDKDNGQNDSDGNYRGVMAEHDNIDYLKSPPTKLELNIVKNKDWEYVKINGIDYRKIKNLKEFEEKLISDDTNRNYYLDFELEKKSGELDIKNANIYTEKKFQVNINKAINIKGSTIIYNGDEEDMEVRTNSGEIKIEDSKILSYSGNNEKDIKIKSKKGNIIINRVEIISYGKKSETEIESEDGNIKIDDTAIISYGNDSEVEIETKKGKINIGNSTILSYGDKVEIESENGNVNITGSVLKAKEEVEIEVKNANIYIDDTTIVAGDRDKKGKIEGEGEIEAKNGKIDIINSVIKSKREIEIEMKSGNGAITIDRSTILSETSKDDEAIELKIKQGKKINLTKSALISTESKKIIIGDEGYNHGIEIDDDTFGIGEIIFKHKDKGKVEEMKIKEKSIEDIDDYYDLPGMPGRSDSSGKDDKDDSPGNDDKDDNGVEEDRDSVYKPGYYKKEG